MQFTFWYKNQTSGCTGYHFKPDAPTPSGGAYTKCIAYSNEITQTDERKMTQITCNHFLTNDGKQQINISYHQMKLILDKINIGGNYITKNMFDVTQKVIYIL